MTARLDGRVAIVTGGARGIGQAYCLGLARAGARVVVADILDTGETVAKVKDAGTVAIGVHVDVASFASVQQMVSQAIAAFQKIDILVNNAALMAGLKMGPFHQIAEEEWDRVMAVNVKGIWQCTRAVTPSMMQQQYGKLINISSTTILMGVPGLLHYVASKGAVFAMTRALARELGPFGIRVNTITPGLTQSQAIKDMIAAAPEQLGAMSKQLAAQAALGREQYPEDLVGTVVFLASADSDFITGQTINVDGGVVHW
ncbi:MAG: 3-oxoacyl-ACP reductase FabG [Deltaproteobacteria bacterium]|nr:3-oxoacyl-ACP reductase FabG [Deltaproteobacteria bacterium]